jgi:hypothetical protein
MTPRRPFESRNFVLDRVRGCQMHCRTESRRRNKIQQRYVGQPRKRTLPSRVGQDCILPGRLKTYPTLRRNGLACGGWGKRMSLFWQFVRNGRSDLQTKGLSERNPMLNAFEAPAFVDQDRILFDRLVPYDHWTRRADARIDCLALRKSLSNTSAAKDALQLSPFIF